MMKWVIFSFAFICLLMFGFTSQAQIEPLTGQQCGWLGLYCSPADSEWSLRNYVLSVINLALSLVGVIALAFVIIGGVQYITTRGNEQQAETAKKTILYAVLGVVIVGISMVIVNFVGLAAGVTTYLPAGNNLVSSIWIIINGFMVLIGLAALIFILIGGIQYITARGEEQQAETAKKTIMYALIGLLVVGLAAVVVNFVLRIISWA